MNDSMCEQALKDNFVIQELRKLVVQKEELIRAQAQQISRLESELERVKVDRDSIAVKLRSVNNPNSSLDRRPSPIRSTLGISQNANEMSNCTHSKADLANSPSLYNYPRDTSSLKLSHIGRQQSHSGHHGFLLQRQRSQQRVEDDAKLRQSRTTNDSYELSADLQHKQIEMLERKYGGRIRARRAAITIQQAFRKFCMNRNFEKLRSIKSEKRRSRILADGRSASFWCEFEQFNSMDYALSKTQEPNTQNTNHNSGIDNGNSIVGTGDQPFHNQCSNDGVTYDHRIQKSASIDINYRNKKQIHTHHKSHRSSESNNNPHLCPEYNVDSSSSNTPQDSPVEHAVDLHSVNFENLLESRETDILGDSFHSNDSQDSYNSDTGTLKHRTASGVADDVDDSTLKRSNVFASFHIGSEDSDVVSDVQIQVDVATPVDDISFLPNHSIDKYHENMDVRLRHRKCQSDSLLTDNAVKTSPDTSPIWKRKSGCSASCNSSSQSLKSDGKRMSNISETSEAECVDGPCEYCSSRSSRSSDTMSLGSNSLGSESSHGYRQCNMPNASQGRNSADSSVFYNHGHSGSSNSLFNSPPRVGDKQRKRDYRIGLNLFNKKPEKGIMYLINRCFIENTPYSVAKFLNARKGLSKQMIGEYLGTLQNSFNMEVLNYFIEEIDLSGLQIDTALRKFQTYFRMPGEAQKIERLMEAFAQRFYVCNHDIVKKFKNADTVFLLAFAIIMLNTDLHNTNIKQDRRMKLEDFTKNLRGIDDGEDVDRDLLQGIYDRIKVQEFKPGADHVTQVMKVEQSVIGKRPQLALSHRRLVCYCRLYEVHDPNKREKLGLHQREVFLFNDLLLVSKIFSKKKTGITYNFRLSFPLCGMQVYLYETPHYQFGIRLANNLDNKVLITFNARNEHDRSKFVEDIKECIMEVNEMEALRIEEELHKQKHSQKNFDMNRISSDSGVVDIDLLRTGDMAYNRLSTPDCASLKKTTLSNSLIDLSEAGRQQRRGSGGSLDSGMFLMQTSTTSVSTVGQDEPSRTSKSNAATGSGSSSPSFKFFHKKGGSSGRQLTKCPAPVPPPQDSTEV